MKNRTLRYFSFSSILMLALLLLVDSQASEKEQTFGEGWTGQSRTALFSTSASNVIAWDKALDNIRASREIRWYLGMLKMMEYPPGPANIKRGVLDFKSNEKLYQELVIPVITRLKSIKE